jgi:hypothetical protein
MKYGSVGDSFFDFAFCTTVRKWLLSCSRIRIATFLAYKSICPFYPGQEFKAFIVALEQFRTLSIIENRVHIQILGNRFLFGIFPNKDSRILIMSKYLLYLYRTNAHNYGTPKTNTKDDESPTF